MPCIEEEEFGLNRNVMMSCTALFLQWLEMKTRKVKRRKLKERNILCAINAFYALYIIHVWCL